MYNITLSAPTWRRGLTTLAATAMLLTSAVAQAQYVDATTPDESAAGTSQVPFGVENTGNADAVTDGKILRMMCWDGSAPSLAWDFVGQKGRVSLTNAAGAVADPDVVINPESNTATSTQLAVTYLAAGHVYVEVWSYNASTNTCTRLNTRRVDTGTALCTNPNIDANITGQAAIVYEQSASIKARALNLSAANGPMPPTAILTLTPPSGYTFSQPDVAVYVNRTMWPCT